MARLKIIVTRVMTVVASSPERMDATVSLRATLEPISPA